MGSVVTFLAYLEGLNSILVKNPKNETVACSIIFIYQNTIHLQYMAATKEGRETNALDFLIDELIKNGSSYLDGNTYSYLSLGVSENREESSINEGLFKWKEEFGAKVFSHFVYQIKL